jgi:hypothetical protein
MEPDATLTLMETVTVSPGLTTLALCPTETEHEVISVASAACGAQ